MAFLLLLAAGILLALRAVWVLARGLLAGD